MSKSLKNKVKLNDVVSVKDFGAVGDGVTNDTASFNLAIAAVSTRGTLVCPYGNYIVTTTSLTYGGKTITFDLSSGALINGDSVNVANAGSSVARYGIGPTGAGLNYSSVQICDVANGASGGVGKVDGLSVAIFSGGSSVTGGRHAIEGTTVMQVATSATNADRNYAGIAGVCIAQVNDNGTAISPKGAVFGLNGVGALTGAATYFANCTGAEFNTNVQTGCSVSIKTGIQITGFITDAVKGTDLDAMVSLSGQPGGVKWTDGICFNAFNGAYPMDATLGTLLRTRGTATVKSLIDVTSYTFTNWLISANNFSINNLGSIEMGQVGTANTPYLNFHSSASSTAYDVRLIATGGTASAGAGNLIINASTISSTATAFLLNSTQVVGVRNTGWGAGTNGSKAALDASTATLAQTAAAVAQIMAALTTHGLIGA